MNIKKELIHAVEQQLNAIGVEYDRNDLNGVQWKVSFGYYVVIINPSFKVKDCGVILGVDYYKLESDINIDICPIGVTSKDVFILQNTLIGMQEDLIKVINFVNKFDFSNIKIVSSCTYKY